MEIEERDASHRPGKIWCKKGDMFYWHREDGPAAIMEDGYEEWYYNDQFYKSSDKMPLNLFLYYCKWELNKLKK